MKAVVKKRRKSVGILIPSSAIRTARLKLGEIVEIKAKRGHLLISSLGQYDLGELARSVTAKNKHKLADFGRPVGKEAW